LNQPLDVAAPGVLRNDHDVEVEDTAPLHAVLVAGPSHGQLTFHADGSFSYVPSADYLGVDSFTYQAVDHFNAAGNVNTVTLTTAIKAIAGSVSGGGTVAIGSGAVDPSDPLHSSVTSPAAATVTIAQGVIAASQAPTGYTFLNQQINIVVAGNDGSEIVASPTNPIVLSFAIDRSLVPASQDYSTFQMFRNGVLIPGCPGATTITAANLDPCVTGRAAAGDGDVVLTILTTHASRWNMGLSADGVGNAPVAMNDGVYSLDFGQSLSLPAPGVLANDIARSAISARMINAPGAGTLALNSSGAFVFTPAAAQCGPVTFTYVANDGSVDSSPATVTLLIDCLPHATDDTVSVPEDSGVTAITVLSNDNDPDPGQTLTISSTTQGSHGVVGTISGGAAVTYRPDLNYFGADSFTYTITDGRGGSATATVNVTVLPVNDAPSFTKGGNQTVLEDAGPQTVANWASAMSAGPANESGQVLSFSVTSTNPAMFSAQPAVSANGTLTYTSAPNANGSATVTVVLHDDGGTANGGIDASAGQSFTITVTPVNDAPVATNASLSVTEDTPKSGTLSATDVDGDTLTYTLVANGAKGTAVITNAATGAFTYTPAANANGTDTFTFRASDASLDSNVATVTVTITAVNDVPSFTKGANQTVREDAAAQSITGWATAISAGPADESGQALNFIVSNSNNALFSAQPAVAANGTLTFTPAATANGSATVTVQLHDNGGVANGGVDTSAAQTFTITVTAVNDAPSFTKGANQSATQNSGAQTVTGWATAISAGPSDESAQVLNFIVSNSNNALFSAQPAIAANGTLTYTSATGANGSATVTVSLHDNGGVANGGVDTSAAQTFTITINPPPGISISDSSVLEGNSGFTPMPFTVTLTPAATSAVTVNWATAGGTALSPKDFTAASGTLTFAPGETTKTITVQIVGDTTKEKDETMGVLLSNAVGAQITDGSGLGTILDDDSTPRFSAQLVNTQTSNATTSSPTGSSLSLASPTLSSATTDVTTAASTTSVAPVTTTAGAVIEGDTGKKILTFAIVPTNATDQVMSVDFATIAGPSARPNIDFTVISGTLVFAPETADPQYITVEVMANKRHQPTHPFLVRLANPVAAVVDGIDTEADILDDDPIPTITVSDVTVGESATGSVNAVVNVVLSNDTDDVVTVNYATVAGAALDGVDYIGQSGVLTFAPGVTSLPVTITINPDSTMTEALESFYLDITSPTNATIGKGRGTVTITPVTAWVNSTTADFAAGTLGTGAYISETANGEVTLAPALGAEFKGTTVDAGWSSGAAVTGGTATIANGVVTIDGAAVTSSGANSTVAPGRSLEFSAKFSGAANQNVGFTSNGSVTTPPFAVFGTKVAGALLVRTSIVGRLVETPIAAFTFNQFHKFRIDWTSSSVTYWIDGVQVATHTVAVVQNMKPFMADGTLADGALVVDYIRMTPYAASGVYTSKVYNAGAPVTWTTANWLADMPATGATVTIEVRTGNTATPDTTWTPFAKIAASGGTIPTGPTLTSTTPPGPRQYAQYRITLGTTVASTAPAVKELILAFTR
jgi:VCBS repeat-containing protein